VFSRFDYEGIIAGVIGINSAPRWAQVRRNYEQYAITGMKVEWFKVGLDGSRSGPTAPLAGVLNYVWQYEDVDTYDTAGYTEPQVVALETFKAVDKDHHVVYRDNKPLASV